MPKSISTHLPHHPTKRHELRHGAGLLEGAPGLANGVVEVGPLLGLVLGLEEVADGAETVAISS